MNAYCGAASDVGARVSSEFYNGPRLMVTGKDTTLSLQSGRSPEATERAVRAFVQKLVDEGEGGIGDFENLLMERVEYEAKRAVAYNTIDNARRDPDRPRFARVPQGERTCDFCLMLASRGPVYLTAESAGAYTKFHAHCDCKVVPFWDSVEDGFSRRRGRGMSIEGYDPDALYKQYQERMKDRGTDTRVSFADRMAKGAKTAKARRKEERSNGNVKPTKTAITTSGLKTQGDPAVEYFGPAESSNPGRLRQIKAELKQGGVEVVVHPKSDESIGYDVASRGGGGARIHVTEGMSLSAWEHELDHYHYDESLGFPGIAYYIANQAEWDMIEARAYLLEVENAKVNGYNELVKQLELSYERDLRERGRID